MKKRELSPKELKHVVELRRFGFKWTEIEKEAKVERRAAKRAYEEWERDKKLKEQESIRFRVMAEAFHEHLDDLVRLAESFIEVIHVPKMLRGLNKTDKFLDQLWIRNIIAGSESFPTSHDGLKRIVGRNKMLFKSLQDHTRGKVPWEAFEEWEEAWDNTVDYSEQLWPEIIKVVGNMLNYQSELKERIETAAGNINIIEKISEGIRESIWQGILTDKPDQLPVLKKGNAYNSEWVWIEFSEDDTDTKLDLNEVGLGKDTLNMCRQVVAELREMKEPDLVKLLSDNARLIQDKTEKLEKSLDRLVLRPILLRTRCDLCPA